MHLRPNKRLRKRENERDRRLLTGEEEATFVVAKETN